MYDEHRCFRFEASSQRSAAVTWPPGRWTNSSSESQVPIASVRYLPFTSLPCIRRYVAKYTGNERGKGRFLDPHFSHSAPVRLFHRSQPDIVRYLLNYMGRDRRYTEKV